MTYIGINSSVEINFQKNHYGIYCIECTITKTKYIGQTYENFYRRWIFHRWNLKNNRHSNIYLQNSWNKYGECNFKFYPVEFFDTKDKSKVNKAKLNELECFYIDKFDTFNNGFNLTTGGDSCTMQPKSEDAKRKIGEKNRINMTGKCHSECTKRLMSEVHRGIVKTPEHRLHLSQSLTGLRRSDEQKEKCRIANQGSKQKTAKYTEDLIEQIRIDYMGGLSLSQLTSKYKFNKGTMCGIIYNHRWKHVVPQGWEEFIKNKRSKTKQ